MAAKVKAQEETVGTVSVVVVAPFQVSHEATVFGPGESVSVPAEVAAHWVANGWAEPA